MIKNILFDLDDTILDFKTAERMALSKALTTLGITPTYEIISRYSELNILQWKCLERGEISRAEVKLNRYRLLFDEFGIDVSPQLATSLYEDNLCIGHYFIDSAEETIKLLSESYNLYIVSNGTKRVQDSRIASAGIEDYFKGIFISEDVGVEKPSVKFFEYCFSKIADFSPDETIIVGDSLTSDILGGKNSGIKAIWFNSKNQINSTDIKPDYEISSHKELVELLKTI